MSLVYLAAAQLRGRLRDLLRHPARLVAMLLFAAMLVLSLATAGETRAAQRRSPEELGALVLLLYGAVFALSAMRGFDSGASFYTAPDTHFVFPAPISPRSVLFYGLIRQMGTSLLVGFFLLFQYSWLHMLYGLTAGGLVAILLGFGACMFCAQLAAMALYACTSGGGRLRRGLRAGFIALCAAAALYAASPAFMGVRDPLRAVVARAGSLPLTLFPVAGWLRGAVLAFLGGRAGEGAGWALLCAAAAAAAILVIMRMRPDFYEDVLQAAQASQSAITARKEGRAAQSAPRRVRVGKTGIGRGEGASVFYYKHLLEDRRAGAFLLDGTSLLFLCMNWGFAYLAREGGIVPLLCFSVYLQIFSTGTGHWARELTLPFVYLLPERPFVKLWNVCRESVLKIAVESALLFVPAALLLGLTPAAAVLCIVMRVSFGLLFVAGNLLMERVFGSSMSRTVVLFLYFFGVLLLAAPGVVLGIAAAAFTGFRSIVPALAVIALWNAACAALIGFLCRDILDVAEQSDR